MSIRKLRVLLLGHKPYHNFETVERLYRTCDVIETTKSERERPNFLENLRTKKWGDFDAILRPFWYEGNEMEPFDRELISLLPKSLKIHSSCGAGYDWMDISLYTEKGILYCNGGAACAAAVADMALWMILSVFRNLFAAGIAGKSGNIEEWQVGRVAALKAHSPENHKLGIIGLGNIGYLVAKKAFHGLGTKIQYYDIKRRSKDEEEAVCATFFDSLEDLVANSDCVIVCVPFGGRRMFDATVFAKFKKGSRFINLARGPLHDEAALADALKSGHISAAGLDVQEEEPKVNPELIKMSNVTITPHNAGTTTESNMAFEKLAMDNIEAFITEGKGISMVNAGVLAR